MSRISIFSFIIYLFVFCFLFSVASSSFAEKSPIAIGFVTDIHGTVHASLNGNKRELKKDSSIYRTDTITIGPQSSSFFTLTDQTQFNMGSESKIVLSDYVFDDYGGEAGNSLTMAAVKGVFRFLTGQIVKKNPKSFEISTPFGTMGTRGTLFDLLAEKDRVVLRLLHGGPVFFQDLFGNYRLIIKSGSGVVAQPGKPVSRVHVISGSVFKRNGGEGQDETQKREGKKPIQSGTSGDACLGGVMENLMEGGRRTIRKPFEPRRSGESAFGVCAIREKCRPKC